MTADSLFEADLAIRGGTIAQIGGKIEAAAEIDAGGKTIFPGGVDMHVHLTPVELAEGTVSWADDFASGSRAAAAGGITTIGNISFPRPGERLGALLERVTAEAEQESIVDFVLHPVLLDPDTAAIAEIPELARRGQPSLKIFMILGDFDARAGDYLEAMATAERAGC